MNPDFESITRIPFVEIVPNSLYFTKLSDNYSIKELNKLVLDEFYQSKSLNKIKKNYIHSAVLSKKTSSYQPILLKAKELLIAAGFQGLTNRSIIELYSYNMDGGTVASKFTIHADNDAYLDSNVVTCIFYTQKDSSIIDGNLEYYENDTPPGWFSGFFPKYKKIGLLDADAGNVVLMSGKQLHVPQTCGGVGKRNCVVVHVVVE